MSCRAGAVPASGPLSLVSQSITLDSGIRYFVMDRAQCGLDCTKCLWQRSLPAGTTYAFGWFDPHIIIRGNGRRRKTGVRFIAVRRPLRVAESALTATSAVGPTAGNPGPDGCLRRRLVPNV